MTCDICHDVCMSNTDNTQTTYARMTLAQIHDVVARDSDMCITHELDENTIHCERADDLIITDAHDRDESVSDDDVERFRLAYVKAVNAMYECDMMFHELFDCR